MVISNKRFLLFPLVTFYHVPIAKLILTLHDIDVLVFEIADRPIHFCRTLSQFFVDGEIMIISTQEPPAIHILVNLPDIFFDLD